MHFLTRLLACGAIAAVLAGVRPAAALTITPYFDSSITTAGNASQVEGAITTAIGTIDSLYSNSGTVSIVFSQASGNFLGESSTADYNLSYSSYTTDLTTVSHKEPANTILATAIANLSSGNKPGNGGSVMLTSADARVALGLSGATGCFNMSGTFVSGCGQSYDGTVTLSTNYTFNYGTTAVPGQYSAINTLEHEIDEILGGGGQGSTLNSIAFCNADPSNSDCIANSNYTADIGVLDPYRYSAPGVTSFTTSTSNSVPAPYLSVDGGKTSIVCFNQNTGIGSISQYGDFADFCTNTNVQSAFTNSGGFAPYTTASPEYAMMESIGYAPVPEPASLAVLAGGLAALRLVRRRVRTV